MTMAMSVAMELHRRWDRALERLNVLAPTATHDWLRTSWPVDITDGTLLVGVYDGEMAEFIEQCKLAPHRSILERFFPGLAVRVVPFPAVGNGAGPAAGRGPPKETQRRPGRPGTRTRTTRRSRPTPSRTHS